MLLPMWSLAATILTLAFGRADAAPANYDLSYDLSYDLNYAVDADGTMHLYSMPDLTVDPAGLPPDRDDRRMHVLYQVNDINENLECRDLFGEVIGVLLDFDTRYIYPGFQISCTPYRGPEQPLQLRFRVAVEATHSDHLGRLDDYLASHEGREHRGLRFHFEEAVTLVSTMWIKASKLTADADGNHSEILEDSSYRMSFRSFAYYDAFLLKRARTAYQAKDIPTYLAFYANLFGTAGAEQHRTRILPRANYLNGIVDTTIVLKNGVTVPSFTQSLFINSFMRLDCREFPQGMCAP